MYQAPDSLVKAFSRQRVGHEPESICKPAHRVRPLLLTEKILLTQYHSTGCSLPLTLRKGDRMTVEFTIGQLAKQVGVNIQTVRYYERRKLLTPTARRPSGYRLYGEEALNRLRFIKNAQALGFTLQEVTELLNLRVSSKARCGDVQKKAQAKLAQVEAKIQDLRALDRALQSLIRSCHAGQPTDHCPILKAIEDNSKKPSRSPKGRR